jgi:hypothetical protein
MTLACATVMAAGTAATANDKAAAPVAAQPVAATPGSFAQVMGADWQGLVNRGGGTGCSCPSSWNAWWNGDWDGVDGQVSHEGGGAPNGAVAADDFYLCEGYIHNLKQFDVTVLNNSSFGLTRARLEIYSDCNGCPDELLYVLKTHSVQTIGAAGNGFTEYVYSFLINDQQTGECPGESTRGDICSTGGIDPTCVRNIALRGGTYWLSVVGKTDGQMSDLTFWATTGDQTNVPFNEIKGSVAKKREGVAPTNWNDPYIYISEWESVEECCVGCTDLAFRVCFESCKILLDNGHDIGGEPSALLKGARSERSGLIRNSRAADDFVVPPCADFEVCHIEACIYTNCDPAFRGFYEIYSNDCNLPDYEFGDTPLCTGLTTKRVCLGYEVSIDGVSGLDAYRLEFHKIGGCVLASGQQYWLSIGVDDTFSFIERGYFCRNAYCDRDCTINFNPGAVLDPAATYNGIEGVDEWTSTAEFPARWGDGGTDFAFTIAGNFLDGASGPNAEPVCMADADNNGTVEVSDIFTFLSAWFAGCP